jgi:hypothetical protein
MAEVTCRHCRVRIRLVNFALGARWMHDPDPHRFGDEYWFCRREVAEPDEGGSDERVRGLGAAHGG